MAKPDLSKSIEYYMSKGHSRGDAELLATAQYEDDCLIFAEIDRLVVKKEFPEVVMQVREGVEVDPVICGKCGEITVSRIENREGQVGYLNCLKDFLTGQGKPGVDSLPE